MSDSQTMIDWKRTSETPPGEGDVFIACLVWDGDPMFAFWYPPAQEWRAFNDSNQKITPRAWAPYPGKPKWEENCRNGWIIQKVISKRFGVIDHIRGYKCPECDPTASDKPLTIEEFRAGNFKTYQTLLAQCGGIDDFEIQ